MRIDWITLRELGMRLKAPFRASTGISFERRILLVEAHADGVTGWGEITAEEGPFYNSECTDTAWQIVRDFIRPMLLGRTVETASEIPSLLRTIRGHEMARAGVENAFWDIEAQQRGLSLTRLLGGTQQEIACGVSIGIQEDMTRLLKTIEEELRAGYQRIKIKIEPGLDINVVEEIRRHFPAAQLMVDANSAYGPEHFKSLKRLDDYGLLMIEQPLAWDDIYHHSLLQKQLRTPICLDESIHNSHHAEAAIALQSCRIINIKLGRVGGHTEARNIQALCQRNQIPVWCGGMLESGVGRVHNIAMSTLPGFTLPGDVSASQRYWHEDIIEPEVQVTPAGTIAVPSTIGLGYAVNRDRVERLTVRRETWKTAESVAVV